MKDLSCNAPFEYLVLDVKFCGTDGQTGKSAVLLLFMDCYTGIVFHSQYTTQSGKGVLVKFLRVICNKYNFDNLNINFKLITALDEPLQHLRKPIRIFVFFILRKDTNLRKCIRNFVTNFLTIIFSFKKRQKQTKVI